MVATLLASPPPGWLATAPWIGVWACIGGQSPGVVTGPGRFALVGILQAGEAGVLSLPIDGLLALLALLGLSLLTRRLLGREWLQHTMLEVETPAGRRFDRLLLLAIAASVVAVLLESEPALRRDHAASFRALEWLFTLVFGYEYLLRLLISPQPWRYARSALGLIDLAAIVPTFLELLLSGSQVYLVLRVLRVLRLLRLFRVLRLGAYQQESDLLWRALLAGRRKIAIFLLVILALVVVIGALMYVIEAGNEGFRSIPVGIYWAVVTITTVGYGDVAPVTDTGRLMASVVMLLGYSIIAVPTGIFGAALVEVRRDGPRSEAADAAVPDAASPVRPDRLCPACGAADHSPDARHCRLCGERLPPPATKAPSLAAEMSGDGATV